MIVFALQRFQKNASSDMEEGEAHTGCGSLDNRLLYGVWIAVVEGSHQADSTGTSGP